MTSEPNSIQEVQSNLGRQTVIAFLFVRIITTKPNLG